LLWRKARVVQSGSFGAALVASGYANLLGGTLRFGSATELNTYVEVERSNKETNDVKMPSDNVAEIPAERLNDLLVAGATAITDIDNVINELQAARDYLQAEAERVWRDQKRDARRTSDRCRA
jgi:hypothetical protein